MTFVRIQSNNLNLENIGNLKTFLNGRGIYQMSQTKMIEKHLTQLRICAHQLIIETGRYAHIDECMRICPCCNEKKIEN